MRGARADAVAAVRVAGFGDDAGVVPAAGQHEGDLRLAQVVQLVDRAPWRHVVSIRADHEHRHAQVGQRHRAAFAAADAVGARGQRVVQVQRGEVLVVHARRHVRGVGVPGHQVAALLAGRTGASGRAIPIVGMARAGADGFFDENGFPVGAGETVHFPDLGEDRVYALEIAGDSMEPMYRAGDVVIVQPGAAVRRGDRVVVRTSGGEVMAKMLGRKNDQMVELLSLNPAHKPRELATTEIEWIARIVWASQ